MKAKIHDFGQLGKWSEDTLKANSDNGRYLQRVNLIEEKYNVLENAYNNHIDDIQNMKIPVQGIFKRYVQFKELSSQYDYQNILQLVNKYEQDKKELEKCLVKYRSIMDKLKSKGKKK